MTGWGSRLASVLLLGALALGIAADRPDPLTLPPADPSVTPEMRAAAAELLAARRENARRQRAGEPAGWMR